MSREFDNARRMYHAEPNNENKFRLILIMKRLGILTDKNISLCYELGDKVCSRIHNPHGYSKTPEMPTKILEYLTSEETMLMFLYFVKKESEKIEEKQLVLSEDFIEDSWEGYLDEYYGENFDFKADSFDYQEGPDPFYSERFNKKFRTNKELIKLVIDDISSSLKGGKPPTEDHSLRFVFDTYFGNMEVILSNLSELERLRKIFLRFEFLPEAQRFLMSYTDPRGKLINYFLDRHL